MVLHHPLLPSLQPCTRSLQEINISNNRVGDSGVIQLKLSLLVNQSVTKMILVNTRVTCEGMYVHTYGHAYAHTMQAKINLYITLAYECCVCVGAIAMAEILAENKNLRQLDLRDNDIRVAGLMALSLAHKMNHRLTQLDVPKAIKSDQVMHTYLYIL